MMPKLPITPILLAALVAFGGYHKFAMHRADKRQEAAVTARPQTIVSLMLHTFRLSSHNASQNHY